MYRKRSSTEGIKMLYREDLDALRCDCGKPACEDHMVFHGACHPKEKTWSHYYDGELTIRCAKCNKVVTRIAVARRSEVVANEQGTG
jgi:hypothetical protein